MIQARLSSLLPSTPMVQPLLCAQQSSLAWTLSELCLGGSCVHANQNPNPRQDMSLFVTLAVNPVSDSKRFSISPR